MIESLLNLICGRPNEMTVNSRTEARRKLLALTDPPPPPRLTAPAKPQVFVLIQTPPCPLCRRN